MPEYDGFVASLIDDTKAEVLIQPQRAGIVGAPGVSAKVCHCASSSSQVSIKALNPLQAALGDRVVLKVEASALARNMGSLVGFPVLFLALGWVISLFLGNTVLLGLPITFFCIFCSLPLGIVTGVLLHRHWSRENLPTITRITQTRQEMAFIFGEAQSPKV